MPDRKNVCSDLNSRERSKLKRLDMLWDFLDLQKSEIGDLINFDHSRHNRICFFWRRTLD